MKVPQAIRYAIQRARAGESHRALGRRFNLDPRTVARWRNRSTVVDLSRAPRRHGRRKLGAGDVALLCAVRLATGWPLDRLIAALRPHLGSGVSRQRIAAILAARGLALPPRPRRIPRPSVHLTRFQIANGESVPLRVEGWLHPLSGRLVLRVGGARSRGIRLPPSFPALGKGPIHSSEPLSSRSGARYRRPWWWKSPALTRGGGQRPLLLDIAVSGEPLVLRALFEIVAA